MNDKVMIGDAFILFPIFTDDTSNINRAFPSGEWRYFPSGKILLNEDDDRTKELSGQFDVIHLYMRSGYIVPWQNTFDKYIRNTNYLKQEKLNLIINPDKDNKAKGVIFFDESDGVDTIANNDYMRIDLSYDNGELIVNSTHREIYYTDPDMDMIIERIDLFGTNNKDTCKLNYTFNNNDPSINNMEKDVENDKFYYVFPENSTMFINRFINFKFGFE